MTGSVSQSVVLSAGTYSISLDAAQCAIGPSNQTIEVLVDNVAVSTTTPSSINYTLYTSAAFSATAGTHTIEILGLDPHGGDNTALIDDLIVTTPQDPPAASLTATAVSASQINLAWSSVSVASTYLVDEMVNGAWTQIGSFGGGTTSDAVTGLSAGTAYSFEVVASNSAGATASNSASAMTSSTVTVSEPTAATAYTPVSGALFGASGPLFTDVHQGDMGDCWLMASLAEVAARDPADIRSMFTADGTAVENGSVVSLYTVRFYNNAGVAENVTVDNELPSGGTYYDQATNGVLWVALAEKAYAEANGAGFVTTQSVGSNSYNALNGGDPTWALRAITGKSASDFSINPSNIAAAWNAGELIVLGTSPNANDNLIVGDSEGTHAYAVVNYNASSSTPFELYNPWGLSSVVGGTISYNGNRVYGGAFYATASLISQDFADQSIGAGAATGIGTAANSINTALPATGSSVQTPPSYTTTSDAFDATHASSSQPEESAHIWKTSSTAGMDAVIANWGSTSDGTETGEFPGFRRIG